MALLIITASQTIHVSLAIAPAPTAQVQAPRNAYFVIVHFISHLLAHVPLFVPLDTMRYVNSKFFFTLQVILCLNKCKNLSATTTTIRQQSLDRTFVPPAPQIALLA